MANKTKRARELAAANWPGKMAPDYIVEDDVRVWRFPSVPAFVAACEREVSGYHWDNVSWRGGPRDAAIAAAKRGNLEAVPAASTLIDALRVQAPDTNIGRYVASPAGAFPIVPEFLAGHPLNMRQRRVILEDRAPLRLFVDLTVQCTISHQRMLERGTMLLTLAMMLSEQRALELWAVVAMGSTAARGDGRHAGGIVAINIPARPLELATACHALTSVSFCRGLGYCWHWEHSNVDGGFLFARPDKDGEQRGLQTRMMRDALRLEERDMFTPVVTDGDATLSGVNWLNTRLAELAPRVEE